MAANRWSAYGEPGQETRITVQYLHREGGGGRKRGREGEGEGEGEEGRERDEWEESKRLCDTSQAGEGRAAKKNLLACSVGQGLASLSGCDGEQAAALASRRWQAGAGKRARRLQRW